MVIVLMGVSGAGKSTVGKLLADALDAEFIEADDFHDDAAIEKMASGTPLTEADRKPWLERLRREIDARLTSGSMAVVACSALTAASRQMLGTDRAGVALIHLSGPPSLIASRLALRASAGSHYMPAALLPSQFDALEAPEDAFVVDITLPPEQIVGLIRQGLAEYERPDDTVDDTAGE